MLIPDMFSAADLHFLLFIRIYLLLAKDVRVFLSRSVGNPEIFPFVGAKLLRPNRPVTKIIIIIIIIRAFVRRTMSASELNLRRRVQGSRGFRDPPQHNGA